MVDASLALIIDVSIADVTNTAIVAIVKDPIRSGVALCTESRVCTN
jgi:hypothetical protein